MALAVFAQWAANLFVSTTFKVLDGISALNALFITALLTGSTAP